MFGDCFGTKIPESGQVLPAGCFFGFGAGFALAGAVFFGGRLLRGRLVRGRLLRGRLRRGRLLRGRLLRRLLRGAFFAVAFFGPAFLAGAFFARLRSAAAFFTAGFFAVAFFAVALRGDSALLPAPPSSGRGFGPASSGCRPPSRPSPESPASCPAGDFLAPALRRAPSWLRPRGPFVRWWTCRWPSPSVVPFVRRAAPDGESGGCYAPRRVRRQ